jgi:hypothetical protein
MRVLAIALVILAFFFISTGFARVEMVPPPGGDEGGSRTPGYPSTIVFYDNIEHGNTGWTHGDYTASAAPHFHVDTYMAYGGAGHSWWCGTFNYDADGGYGNSWTDFLKVPSTVVSGYPIVDFAYRTDSEAGYDFSSVQAESGGVYVNLNKRWTGKVAWSQVTGFYLGNKDNPAIVRFKFTSDTGYSDADGIYLSVGGGFACDNVRLYDYSTGNVFFYDDVESGGLCIPGTPGVVGGDFWHIEQCCKAASMSHCWAVSYPDTSFVQPNLGNWLMSPVVDVTGATTCTLSYRRSFNVPTTGGNDGWTQEIIVDGVSYAAGSWWGDVCNTNGAQYVCYPLPTQGRQVWTLDALMPANTVAFRWTMWTDETGCGPDICNSAGIFLDDYKVYGAFFG